MIRLPDLRTLAAFAAVAREGNVTRAAEHLGLTQPAISLQLKRLASEVGVPLFRRTARGMDLTRDGALLAAKAEHVLAFAADWSSTAHLMTAKVRGRLRVGTVIDPEFIRLGAFLKAVVEAGPGLETELHHGMSGEVLARLKTGVLDVGFFLGDLGGSADDVSEPLFHTRELTPIDYRVVAPPALGALVNGRTWRDLAALPWIGTPPASVHNRLLSVLFRELGVRQNIVALVDQEASMLEMVRTGVGLSLCRDQIALREQQARGLVIVDGVSVTTSLRFICLSARRTDPSVRLAFTAIERIWGLPDTASRL